MAEPSVTREDVARLMSPDRRIDALVRILERLPANPARSLPAVKPLSGIDLRLIAQDINAEIIAPLLMAEREDYQRMQRDRDEALATLERERDALLAQVDQARVLLVEMRRASAISGGDVLAVLDALTPADPTGGAAS